MTTQVVKTEEFIEYLTDIADEHGDQRVTMTVTDLITILKRASRKDPTQ